MTYERKTNMTDRGKKLLIVNMPTYASLHKAIQKNEDSVENKCRVAVIFLTNAKQNKMKHGFNQLTLFLDTFF